MARSSARCPAKKPRKGVAINDEKPRKPTARTAKIKPSAHAGRPGWTQISDNRWECAPGLLLQLVVVRNENGFAAWINGRVEGRTVITKLHSSKGRQFDTVILPQLQETILPNRRWNKRTRVYDEPSSTSLIDDRRLFYVGLTRARRFVFLLYSDSYKNDYGYNLPPGPSRFVKKARRRLES